MNRFKPVSAPLSRRQFGLRLGSAAGALALPAWARSHALPEERLAVLVYGKPQFETSTPAAAHLVSVGLQSKAVRVQGSAVRNLHGLVQPAGAADVLWGIGQNAPELVEVFDRKTLTPQDVRRYEGWRFRGHAIPWGEGALVAAERLGAAGENGFLLHLTSGGKLLQAFPSGSIGPHEIVDCGDHFAVAHYGDVPANSAEAMRPGALTFQVRRAGVSFLDKKTMALHRFVPLEDNGAITHLGVSGTNRVLAMGINDRQRVSPQEQEAFEKAYDVVLLQVERRDQRIELPYPTQEVDAEAGVVRQLEFPASKMRRGQSFASSAAAGLTVATFAGSNTLLVHRAGRAAKMLDTREFGIENPRGCALSPTGDRIAVAGHDRGIAVLDALTERSLLRVDLALGAHSHAFWLTS